jgi:hypothetical protein
MLFPFVTPRQSIPFPKGQTAKSVSYQLKLPPLHQGPTQWRPACQKMRSPIELHWPPYRGTCVAVYTYSPVVYPHVNGVSNFGHRNTTSTDRAMYRSASLTSCWLANGRTGTPVKTALNFSLGAKRLSSNVTCQPSSKPHETKNWCIWQRYYSSSTSIGKM